MRFCHNGSCPPIFFSDSYFSQQKALSSGLVFQAIESHEETECHLFLLQGSASTIDSVRIHTYQSEKSRRLVTVS